MNWNSELASFKGPTRDFLGREFVDVDPAEEVRPEDEEMASDEQRVPVSFTEVELYALSEFFNSEDGEMSDLFYTSISKRLLVAAAKAGLYDEVL